MANSSWRPSPQATTRQRIRFRLWDKAMAMARMATIPRMPLSREQQSLRLGGWCGRGLRGGCDRLRVGLHCRRRLGQHPADALPGESRDHPGREHGAGEEENGKQVTAHGSSPSRSQVAR